MNNLQIAKKTRKQLLRKVSPKRLKAMIELEAESDNENSDEKSYNHTAKESKSVSTV